MDNRTLINNLLHNSTNHLLCKIRLHNTLHLLMLLSSNLLGNLLSNSCNKSNRLNDLQLPTQNNCRICPKKRLHFNNRYKMRKTL